MSDAAGRKALLMRWCSKDGILGRPPLSRVVSFFELASVSFANFCLSYAMIHALRPEEYAVFGLGFVMALALAGVYRIGLSVPIALLDESRFLRRAAGASRLHLIMLASVTLPCLLIALLLRLTMGTGFWPLVFLSIACCAVLHLSADIDKLQAMRRWGQVASFATSALLSLAIIVHAFFVWWADWTIETALLGLGALALVKTVLVNLPGFSAAAEGGAALFAHLARRSMGWGVAGNIASALYMTAPQWVLGVLSGPVQLAGFLAVRLPFQPIMIVVRASDIVDKVVFGKIAAGETASQAQQALRTIHTYIAVSAGCGALVALAAPQIIRLLLNQDYTGFATTMQLTAIAISITAVAAPFESVIFKQGKYRLYAHLQFAGMALTALAIYPLIHYFRANGAVLTAILGWLPACAYFLMTYRDLRRQRAAL